MLITFEIWCYLIGAITTNAVMGERRESFTARAIVVALWPASVPFAMLIAFLLSMREKRAQRLD